MEIDLFAWFVLLSLLNMLLSVSNLVKFCVSLSLAAFSFSLDK